MSNRFDNRRILYVLGGLIALLALTLLVKIPKQKATLKEKLLVLDTAKVSRILVEPKAGSGLPFEFIRKNGSWIMQQGDLTAIPEKEAVVNILSEVNQMKPKSLEAIHKSRWKEFGLTDSLAVKVTFTDTRGKILGGLMIGSFTYSRTGNPYSSPNGGGIQGTSYVRLAGENNVYGVDGFVSLSFSGKFNDYRDKTFLKINRTDVTSLSFEYPSDSSFVLTRKDNLWSAGSMAADSAAVAGFLDRFSFLNGQDFRDGFKPAADPSFRLVIGGNNMLNVMVRGYKSDTGDEYILNSDMNPGVYFSSKKEGLFNDVFRSQKYFLAGAGKKK